MFFILFTKEKCPLLHFLFVFMSGEKTFLEQNKPSAVISPSCCSVSVWPPGRRCNHAVSNTISHCVILLSLSLSVCFCVGATVTVTGGDADAGRQVMTSLSLRKNHTNTPLSVSHTEHKKVCFLHDGQINSPKRF